MDSAAKYRSALLNVASAASDFGLALENCARCKGSGSAADGLLAAGGLHFLVANHQLILAQSIDTAFETPVSKEIEKFTSRQRENDAVFQKQIKQKTRLLRKREKDNLRQSKLKIRNLQTYRNSLLELTTQIDDIDSLKYRYYQSSYDLVQDTSLRILSRSGSVVRAQVEIYEGIARKGWSGGGLDDLIAACPDPFTPEEVEEEEETSTVSKLASLLGNVNDDKIRKNSATNDQQKGEFYTSINSSDPFKHPNSLTSSIPSSSQFTSRLNISHALSHSIGPGAGPGSGPYSNGDHPRSQQTITSILPSHSILSNKRIGTPLLSRTNSQKAQTQPSIQSRSSSNSTSIHSESTDTERPADTSDFYKASNSSGSPGSNFIYSPFNASLQQSNRNESKTSLCISTTDDKSAATVTRINEHPIYASQGKPDSESRSKNVNNFINSLNNLGITSSSQEKSQSPYAGENKIETNNDNNEFDNGNVTETETETEIGTTVGGKGLVRDSLDSISADSSFSLPGVIDSGYYHDGYPEHSDEESENHEDNNKDVDNKEGVETSGIEDSDADEEEARTDQRTVLAHSDNSIEALGGHIEWKGLNSYSSDEDSRDSTSNIEKGR